jgi:hypothetical protein
LNQVKFAILICPAPKSSDWELPLRDPAACLLLGWVVEQDSFDGGVPWPVRKLLSQALCRIATVTYLAQAGVVVPHTKHKIAITREVSVMTAMFDDQAYPWTQHGQAAFLSEELVPPVSSRVLTEVVGQRKVEAAERAGFIGVMLPGVDGAVAGLWMFEAGGVERMVKVIEECCASSGAELHVLTEDQFRLGLAS